MHTREQVRSVVLDHLVQTVEELADAPIDTSQSMKALGANSLDIVEIVSCSMRELRIKVPRHELSELENVDQLIDLLVATAQARGSSSAGAPPST
jgi:acyl carrier protein